MMSSYPLRNVWLIGLVASLTLQACGPKEAVVFKQVRNVSLHANSDPVLKGDVVFFNPNDLSMKLKKIRIEVFVDGMKAAEIDQNLQMKIPAKDEFTIPIEAKLALQEQGFLNTVFGMLGGKKKEVHYKGHLKINYHGLPIRVPVDYKSEIRIKI
jgi:LEA14-like dessication related protein